MIVKERGEEERENNGLLGLMFECEEQDPKKREEERLLQS